MGKRSYGSGAVKLRSDGRWEGQLRLADGGRRHVYARSREQVLSWPHTGSPRDDSAQYLWIFFD
jgi:hypothetical protein